MVKPRYQYTVTAGRAPGVLFRLARGVRSETRRVMITPNSALVRPHLEHCAKVWAPTDVRKIAETLKGL